MKPERKEQIDWDTWFAEHQKQCERCRLAMDECDGGICHQAFKMLQRILKQR